MITSPAFADKRYAVLGLARSGAAAAEALLASGAEVTVWDRQDVAREPFEGRCAICDPLTMDLSGFDAVVVSPGVPLNTHPIAAHAAAFGVPIIGDIELFAQARGDLPPHKVVGITGTNGKSTTVALVNHILKSAGVPSLMGGNIGEPIMAQTPLEPNGRGVGVYVLELSSFQIDLTFTLDCDIAALTNITPDHLDRYPGFDAYAASKFRLVEMQRAPHLWVHTDDPLLLAYERAAQDRARPNIADRSIHASNVNQSAYASVVQGAGMAQSVQIGFQRDWASLQGPHNAQNAAVAIAVARLLDLDPAAIAEALRSFRGLPHRMELVGERDGVVFLNDSKATNPASAAPALGAFPPLNGRARLHWIVGGLAKEDGLGACEAFLGNVAAAYTVGEAGPRFAELLKDRVPRVERSELISEAVRRATETAQPGDVVLLSPACASYDQFRDYEKRGEHFRQLVAILAPGDGESGNHANGDDAS